MLRRKLLVKTLLLSRSLHSGNTPETVKAAEIAQKAGAASIVITNDNPNLLWLRTAIMFWYPEAKVLPLDMTGHGLLALKLAVEILNQTEGYENYDEMHERL